MRTAISASSCPPPTHPAQPLPFPGAEQASKPFRLDGIQWNVLIREGQCLPTRQCGNRFSECSETKAVETNQILINMQNKHLSLPARRTNPTPSHQASKSSIDTSVFRLHIEW